MERKNIAILMIIFALVLLLISITASGVFDSVNSNSNNDDLGEGDNSGKISLIIENNDGGEDGR